MDRRAFLKCLPRAGAAAAAAATGLAVVALPATAAPFGGVARSVPVIPGHVLGLRATVDKEDLGYDCIDNCWQDVKEVWFNGKKVEEPVITANERTGYIRAYVTEEGSSGSVQAVKERYNITTGLMEDDTFEAWGAVRIVLDPAGRRTRTSRS